MRSSIIITVVLAVLVLISVVQAFQLYELKSKVAAGGLSVSSSKTAVSSGDKSGELPSNIKKLPELPQMVGGC